MKKVIRILALVIVIIAISFPMTVFADLGSFESYDSGSSWSSSDSYWGTSGSSWSSSSSSSWSSSSSSSWDRDYDYDYSSRNGGSNDITEVVGTIIIYIFFIFALGLGAFEGVEYVKKVKGPPVHKDYYQSDNDTLIIEKRVKLEDETFDAKEFINWVKDLFIKLQEAWSKKDWECARLYETKELFEQHKSQIQGYINCHQTNILEEISVEGVYLSDFRKSEDKEVLTLSLNSKMIDYIIDDDSKKIIAGNKNTVRRSTYELKFIRTRGIKTDEGINTVTCPNCGAQTSVTAAGKCEHCGSVLTVSEFNWVLSSLEKIG